MSNIKYQISNIKYQMANGKFQISNVKFQISNVKSQMSKKRQPKPAATAGGQTGRKVYHPTPNRARR
jgi:hypothetical protein